MPQQWWFWLSAGLVGFYWIKNRKYFFELMRIGSSDIPDSNKGMNGTSIGSHNKSDSTSLLSIHNVSNGIINGISRLFKKAWMFDRKKGISDLIGHTPLIEIPSLSKLTGCTILAKCEFMNIGGSPKDRVALNMVLEAEERGLISPGTGCTLFEGTVGSTGISLATIARARGYQCHIVMPDDQAQEKYALLTALGATIEKVKPCSIIDKNHFVNIARQRAHEMNQLAQASGSSARGYFCNQFENESNFKVF